MKKIKDTVLIQGIKDGNKKYENLLYEKYKKRIGKYLKHKYPSDREIEDNISEILIKIFEKIDQFDKGRSKFYTWVINITKNFMVDKSRKNLNNPVQVSFDSANDGSLSLYSSDLSSDTNNLTVGFSSTSNITPCSSHSLPDQDMENKEALSFISNKIGIEDFHLLNMKYNEGYDYNEMEKEMKMSSNTISNRVSYVRSKLRKKKK